MRTRPKNTAASAAVNPEQTAFVKRKVRQFVIAMSGWYVALIVACVVLVVLDLVWPLFFVGLVGSLAPVPLAHMYFARMRAALEEFRA